jgi:hypothetical protein
MTMHVDTLWSPSFRPPALDRLDNKNNKFHAILNSIEQEQPKQRIPGLYVVRGSISVDICD